MVKPAGETVHTLEERQGLPFEEAQGKYVTHQALQFPSCDTSVIQKASDPCADATKTFHGWKGPQLRHVELKPEGSTATRANGDFVEPETAFLESLPSFIHGHVHLRDMVAIDANVVHVPMRSDLGFQEREAVHDLSFQHYHAGMAVGSIVSDVRTAK